MARGPRKIRAGRKKIDLRNNRTPSTAIPTIRNGRRISQTKGYSTSASSARGQQKKSRMHHKKNPAMAATSLLITHAPRRSSVIRKRLQLQLSRNRHGNFGVEHHVGVFDLGV